MSPAAIVQWPKSGSRFNVMKPTNIIKIPIPCSLVFTLLFLSFANAWAGPVRFYRIGDLSGGIFRSEVRDALRTRTGLVAVGNGTQLDGSLSGDTPVRWTPSGGLVPLAPLVPNASPLQKSIITASAISGNGRVIAARSRSHTSGDERLAVIYPNGGITPTCLGQIPGGAEYSAATAVSDDGSVVYGWSQNATNKYAQAFRWTAREGLRPLGFLFPGDLDSSPTPRGVSDDGSVMIGTSIADATTGLGRGYVYRHRHGMSALPLLPGGTWNGTFGLTPSGRTIVGYGNSTAHPNGEIVLWDCRGRARSLGLPASVTRVSPNNGFGGVSAGGHVVAFTFDTAYVHNRRGWFDLEEVLLNSDIDLHEWTSLSVSGMSSDGTLIFGTGANSRGVEGWIAEFPRGYLVSLGARKGACDNDDEDDD